MLRRLNSERATSSLPDGALAVRAEASDPALVRISYQKYGTLNIVHGARRPRRAEQEVADTFARLRIIPKPIRVSDDVYNGPVPGL